MRSEDQLTEFIHSLGWEIDRPINDYGEDFWIRIFEHGNPTGQFFLIQLKGTDKPKQYQIKKSSAFSYSMSRKKLQQWYRTFLPVFVVLWDVEKRRGYWLHVQPAIRDLLVIEPDLLKTGKGKKQVHIPDHQIVAVRDAEEFKTCVIDLLNELSLTHHYAEWVKQLRESFPVASDIITDILGSGKLAPIPPHIGQQQSLTAYEAALALNPNDVDAWRGKAEISYRLHEMDKALRAIEKAWELQPNDALIAWIRGCVLAEYAIAHDGQPKRMLHEAIALFNAYPNAIRGLQDYNVGNSLSGLGEHEKAIEHYDAALAADPSVGLAAQIWKNRGTCYFHLQDYDEEIKCYKIALELNPHLWQAYSSWAATELHHKNYEAARTLFLQAFTANPQLEQSNFAPLYSLAYASWSLDLNHEAYARINQVLRLKPDHQDAMTLKAFILFNLWREDKRYVREAISFLNSLLIDDPENIFAKSELHLLYQEQGLRDDARWVIEEAVQSANVPSQVLYDYAALLEEDGEFDTAIEQLERALQESQEHHIVHKLGHLKKKVGNYKQAIQFFDLALKDAEDPVHILRDIADCHYLLKELHQCAYVVLMIILLEPDNVTWWHNLAVLLKELNRPELYKKFESVNSYDGTKKAALAILTELGVDPKDYTGKIIS